MCKINYNTPAKFPGCINDKTYDNLEYKHNPIW